MLIGLKRRKFNLVSMHQVVDAARNYLELFGIPHTMTDILNRLQSRRQYVTTNQVRIDSKEKHASKKYNLVRIIRQLLMKLARIMHLTMGRFDSLKYLDSKRIKRFVFVCRGNVCRSPYAEAAAKSLGLSAVSCGVEVTRSVPAEAMAVQAALLRGKDLSSHVSRSIFDVQLDHSDCLVTMDISNLPVAKDVADRVGCQLTLLSLWMDSSALGIDDPYGKPLLYFNHCFDEIDEALYRLKIIL